jgi:Neuraminidase (sialidase)
VWISYHDANASSLLRVQRSDDDGLTWKRVGDVIVGQGETTGDATFNNLGGKIVADRSTGNLKSKTLAFNNLFVSRSTDGGKSWTASLVYHDPRLVSLGRRLAVDPVTGKLYAAWSDGQQDIFFSVSSDHGSTWSAPVTVNVAPANTTAALTNVAAYDGTVDVVYYGTTASSHLDPAAVWNVYIAKTTMAPVLSRAGLVIRHLTLAESAGRLSRCAHLLERSTCWMRSA